MTTHDLRCPACHAAMAERSFGAVWVDVCGDCGGLWFDAHELDRLDHHAKGAGPALDMAVAAAPGDDPGHALRCPRCDVGLADERHWLAPDVELDACGACEGIFLAAGQLAVLRQRPRTPKEQTMRRRRWRRHLSRRKRRREERERRQAALLGAVAITSFGS